MTYVTCRLTAKNRDQLRNPTLGNRVRATFTFFTCPGGGGECPASIAATGEQHASRVAASRLAFVVGPTQLMRSRVGRRSRSTLWLILHALSCRTISHRRPTTALLTLARSLDTSTSTFLQSRRRRRAISSSTRYRPDLFDPTWPQQPFRRCPKKNTFAFERRRPDFRLPFSGRAPPLCLVRFVLPVPLFDAK